MRLIILNIAIVLALVGCDTEHERWKKAMEKDMQSVTNSDWRDDIPFDRLLAFSKICQQHPYLKDCQIIFDQIQDIANTLASCQEDQRSTLCQNMVRIILAHPIASALPKSSALKLPDTPWFWSLPTKALDAQSHKYGYRTETISWWWQAWGSHLLSLAALFLVIGTVINWRSDLIDARKKQAQTNAREYAERIEKEKLAKKLEEKRRIESDLQEKYERAIATAEKESIAAEMAAERQAADAAAKLAQEQAEAQKLLQSALQKTKKSRRKKNDPSST